MLIAVNITKFTWNFKKMTYDHCENDATILRKPRGWILWLIFEETLRNTEVKKWSNAEVKKRCTHAK